MSINKKTFTYAIIITVCIILAGIYVDKTTKINLGIISQPQKNIVQQIGNTLGDYGQAPDFKKGDNWLNTQPLTMANLQGKVVLVDFWTYSCINCIRTLPYVTRWYNTYKDNGLVVVGVHTPEFTFEHDTNNVKNAIAQFGINYPVVQDNDYAIWNSYGNEYWPAEYLINQKGEIVEENFGEGEYDVTENNIRQLLGLAPINIKINSDNLSKISSPEMYFGTSRLANLTPEQSYSLTPKNYVLSKNLASNSFSLGGTWQFSDANAQLTSDAGEVNLKFHAGKVFIVASSPITAHLTITVDGKKQSDVVVGQSKLYTLFDSDNYSDHSIDVKISQKGFEAFTFTFG